MVGYKTYFCVFCITLLPILAVAQNNTNSPYTRYGFGQLSDQNFGNSKVDFNLKICYNYYVIKI